MKRKSVQIMLGGLLVGLVLGVAAIFPLAVAWAQAQQDINKENLVFSGDTFPSSPDEGVVFYRTDLDELYFYNGTGWEATGGSGGGVSDHGALTGLGDDDHAQYLLADGSRALTGNLDLAQNELVNLIVEKGTSFPGSPSEGRLFYRSDLDDLYYYNGTGWESTGGGGGVTDHGGLTGLGDDDHSQYLLADGSRALTGDWDVDQNQLLEMLFQQGTSFPSSPVEGQPFWRTDTKTFYVYNGSDWDAPSGTQGPAGPAGSGGSGFYTYLTEMDGSDIKITNRTGDTVLTTTNMSYAFQWMVDQVKSQSYPTGGRIGVWLGDYPAMQTYVFMNDSHCITIEGISPVGVDDAKPFSVRINVANGASGFWVYKSDGIEFKNLHFKGSYNGTCEYAIKIEGEEVGVYNPNLHKITNCYFLNFDKCIWAYQQYGSGLGVIVEHSFIWPNPRSTAWGVVLQESSHWTFNNVQIDGGNYANCLLICDSGETNMQGAETLLYQGGLIINGLDGVAWNNSGVAQNGMAKFEAVVVEDLVNAFHVIDASGSRRIAVLDMCDTFNNDMDIKVEAGQTFYFTLQGDCNMDKNKISTNAIIQAYGARGWIKTSNAGTATVANGDWTAHGLWKTPRTVIPTQETMLYDGVAYNVGVTGMNSTHWQVGLYWVNGTAITDQLDIPWQGETK